MKLQSYLVISASLFFLLSLTTLVDCVRISEWDKSIENARYIQKNQHILSSNILMVRLTQIKHMLRRNANQPMLLKMSEDDRMVLVAALSLLRLSEVGGDHCTQAGLEKKNTPIGELPNQHQGNFIELSKHVKESYSSRLIHELARRYFQAQLYICRNSLLINFSKVRKQLPDEVDLFSRALAGKFEGLKPYEFETMRTSVKASRLLQFMIEYYSLDILKQVSEDHTRLSPGANQVRRFKHDCDMYILKPFRTLMMTYDVTGRNLPILEQDYGQIIQAYDLCSKLNDSMTRREMTALTAYYNDLIGPDDNPQRVGFVAPAAGNPIAKRPLLTPPLFGGRNKRLRLEVPTSKGTAEAKQQQGVDVERPALITQDLLGQPGIVTIDIPDSDESSHSYGASN